MKKINYVIMDICRAQMYGLNPTETMLVSYLHRFLSDTPLYIDGEAWYSCDFTFIIDNCPVITDKEDTLRRLFRKIEDKGLITTLWLGTRRYFQPSDDLRNWGNSVDEDMIVSDENIEEREKNPTDGKKIPSMGKKSHRWEKNPTDGKKIPSTEKNPVSLYNNNINNNNNNILNNISSNNISSNNISNNNLLNNNNNNILLNNKEENKERKYNKERKKKESEKDEKEDKSIKRLFRNSCIYVGEDYERLEQMFAGAEYQDIDIVYYYHAVADWSDSSNTKRTDRGWLATIRNFIRSDMERGKLHKKHDNEDIDPDLMAYLKM